MSDRDFAEQVRELAYSLWQQAGEPEGREEEFWLQAEHTLRVEEVHKSVIEASPEEAVSAPPEEAPAEQAAPRRGARHAAE